MFRRLVGLHVLLAAVLASSACFAQEECKNERTSTAKSTICPKDVTVGTVSSNHPKVRGLFDVVLSSELFHNLYRKPDNTYVKDDKTITTYPDSTGLAVFVKPRITATPPEFSIEGEKNLRFSFKWLGPDTEEKELDAEYLTDIWTEHAPPDHWYAMKLSTKHIPLSREFELHVWRADGSHVACLKAHL